MLSPPEIIYFEKTPAPPGNQMVAPLCTRRVLMGGSDPHFPRILEANPRFPHFFKILTFLTFSKSSLSSFFSKSSLFIFAKVHTRDIGLPDIWLVRGPPLDSQGGGAGVFVAGKLFISTGLGGALKISHFVTCLYGTVLEVNYLFHAESARNYLFQK